MTHDLQRYTESNRAAWNEAMPYHQRAAKDKWDGRFAMPGYSCLAENELEEWQRFGLTGKAVAHLCCNNGVELMSLKNLGAGECVGFDISDAAILEAQERAALCNLDCRFVRTDVYAIDRQWDGRFDVVYITIGALGWLPDLARLFARAAMLLKEGGGVFIHEIHPLAEILPDDGKQEADPLRINDPYFKAEPWVDYGDLDYVGGVHYDSVLPQYGFAHPLSDVIMALIGSGLVVERFVEYDIDTSAGHKRQEGKGLPLSYILVARR